MDLIIDLLIAALVLLAIYGTGRALRRLVRLEFWSRAADLAYSLALGLGTAATALFLFSLVGLLVPAVGWGLVIVGVVLAVAQWRMLRDDLAGLASVAGELRQASGFVKLMVLMGLVFASMNLIGDLAPPTEGDTIHQYLLAPRDWVAAERYVQPTHIWASTLPGNMMMISAWALLLRQSYSLAALVTGFGMSLFFALGVYALARQHFERQVAVLAVAAIMTMPDAAYLAQSAKVDMGWAFFETLALAAFLQWIELSDEGHQHTGRWLILAGVCLGWAAGSKTQTFISVALLGLWIVSREIRRRDWRGLARSSAIFSGAVIAAALPFYLYNGIEHHNPFYPVFADVFVRIGGTPSPRSELGTEVFYPWTVGGYLANLWNASLGHRSGFYLGFIVGPIFLMTIPIGVMLGLLRGHKVIGRMLRYAFAFSVVWFVVKQAARHFLPGLVLLAVIAGAALWRLDEMKMKSRRLVQGLVLLSLLGNVVIWLGVYAWSGSYRVALGAETRAEYLARWHSNVVPEMFPDWETIMALNELLGPEDRVLTAHPGSALYIEPQLVSGRWGDRMAYDGIGDAETLIALMDEHNIQYVLAYSIGAPNDALYATPEFLEQYAEPLYEGPRAQLYRMIGPEGD